MSFVYISKYLLKHIGQYYVGTNGHLTNNQQKKLVKLFCFEISTALWIYNIFNM